MSKISFPMLLIAFLVVVSVNCSTVTAFGAGNIASISNIEGRNFRHGDIEDMLKTVAFLKGHKWTGLMLKRVYYGNWLRDYSQALDVGTLKGIQSGTIRILVWVLSFLAFGYATGEFEVTDDRLNCYRPEEHIDNPKDYADNVDARTYDPRLRPPVQPVELQVDPETGMKNYIANERIGIATSAGYIKYSFTRSIHFGRVYTSGASGTNGREADLCEALRCLGQGLHCVEDFGAHTNYTELALREMGFRNVFPHTGAATEMNVRSKNIYPLVTGTFGTVDFLHSVLGEAQDNFAQSEIDQMDKALGEASVKSQGGSSSKGFGSGSSPFFTMTSLLGEVPGTGNLVREAGQLQEQADAQEAQNRAASQTQAPPSFAGPPGSMGGPPGPGIPGMSADFDPVKTARQIYPILEFRDKVVKAISSTIEKIPGLEKLAEKITEMVTMFVLSLLAPFIRPIINAVAKQLKTGSSTVIDASGKHQFAVWEDPKCSDPSHSLLSKDHFSNILNEPAGLVACTILQYVAPRIIYAWQHPEVPVHEVLDDINGVFHHPALRDPHCELHQKMFSTVEQWVHRRPDRGNSLNDLLSSESVRHGKNHVTLGQGQPGISSIPGLPQIPTMSSIFGGGSGGHAKMPWDKLAKFKESAGLSRDVDESGNRDGDSLAAFPGMKTAFDNNDLVPQEPPTSEFPQHQQQPYQSYQPEPPPSSQNYPEHQYQSQGPYNTQPSYGDPGNAPMQSYNHDQYQGHGYASGGPPPPQDQYGQYAPPPQGQYGQYPPQGGPPQGYQSDYGGSEQGYNQQVGYGGGGRPPPPPGGAGYYGGGQNYYQ